MIARTVNFVAIIPKAKHLQNVLRLEAAVYAKIRQRDSELAN